MNTAILVYSHYSRDARVRRYAEALARKGFKVDVICLKENYSQKESNINLITFPFPRIRLGRIWYILEYILFFIFSLLVLSFRYFFKKYKVIHVNNMPEILVFSSLIPKLFGSKIILDMHDPMPELYMSKYHVGEESLMVKGLKWLEKISFAFADKIITANEAFKSLFLKRLNLQRGSTSQGDKISVILNCPDSRIFPNEVGPRTRSDLPRNERFTLFYMGTVDERFGLDMVIDAMPNLTKKIPGISFTIIPKIEEEGECLEKLKLETRNLKLEKYIQFLSPLPLEKIAEKLKEADIGIVLAKNGVFTENIFPVKLLEFVQMGIPVIATKTKNLCRYFRDDQIYFLKKNTSREFAEAVFNLYRHRKLRQNYAQKAKQYLYEYNWSKEERKYLAIIDRLIRN